MRRLPFLVLFLLCVSGHALAEGISRAEAQRAGEIWLSARQARSAASADARIADCLPLMAAGAEDVLLGYHLPLTPQGHLVISARRELPPVKSFSFETDFDPTDDGGYSTLLMESLAATENYIAGLDGDLPPATAEAFARHRENWSRLMAGATLPPRMETVGPLIQSSWSQGGPYNNDCPSGYGGGTCVVGCVATSAAMILKYWEYPDFGIGSHSYLWGGDDSCGDNVGGGYLNADFWDGYDWGNILHSYSGGYTPAQAAAVAELNYEAAVAFEMDFGVCASGTYVAIGAGIYPEFFGYEDDIEFINRNAHTADAWWGQIRGELDAFPPRPMHYRITSHSIICDGYQEDVGVRYYHMNYGWGGSQNSWYALDDVYCNWDGCNYLSEGMLVRIEPSGYFSVTAPAAGAVWTHGDAIPAIAWNGASGAQVVLDLYNGYDLVTRLGDWTANDGSEQPPGIVDPAWGTGNHFRVKVVGDDLRFGWSAEFGVYGAGAWSEASAPPLNDDGSGQAVAWGDCDGDGWADLYLSQDSSPNLLFGNQAGAAFTEMGGAPLDVNGHSRGAAWADMDNDGDLDLYLVRTSGEANQLFRNDGGGFSDISADPVNDSGYGSDAAWGDYDADGLVDLYVVNAYAPDRLLRNLGGGAFVDVTGAPLGDAGFGRSVAWVDYDNDGDLDLYLVRSSTNKLYRNEGGGLFADQSGPSGLADGGNGYGGAWGDYDGDGDLDLYLSNNGPNRLYRNEGDGSFSNATSPPLDDDGSGRGVAWGDFDCDGGLDLYLVNNGANKLFQNLSGGNFADSTHPLLGDGDNGNGAAWSDFDGDGDLDLYLANSGTENHLLRNDTSGGHWLKVDLVGSASNRLGLGARVELILGGERVLRQLGGDAGYLSRNALTLHFGLGTATLVDTLRIHWPSGIRQDMTAVAVDQHLSLAEVVTAADDAPSAGFGLLGNHPNPFNPSTAIRFNLPEAASVDLGIFDLAGRRLRVLLDGETRASGAQSETWDGRDDAGLAMPSGVYFARLEAAGRNDARKLVLLK